MTDYPFAEEAKDFVLELFHKDNTYGTDEWKTLTPIELGILSWYLNNFYVSSLWWIAEPTQTCSTSRCAA